MRCAPRRSAPSRARARFPSRSRTPQSQRAGNAGGSNQHFARGQIARGVARVGRAPRLDQKHMGLLVRARAMLNPAWDHIHLPGVEHDVLIAQLHRQPTAEHQEEIIRVVVRVPHELPEHAHDRNLVVVQQGDDPWLEVVVELLELCFEVDLLAHAAFISLSKQCGNYTRSALPAAVGACVIAADSSSMPRQPADKDVLLAKTMAGMRALQVTVDATDLYVARRARITVTELRCLDVLAGAACMTAGALAELTGLTGAEATFIVRRLLLEGYVCRATHQHELTVAPTTKARRLIDHLYSDLGQ